ncbi:hypothetical protein ILUMI_09964 [Ignelater luminosus]|uniref:Gamma-interferon-inducible lysosomal thiol reductase n=1 Tax=Ignelater luminosus TaxID=2038154 RepID=A0A8K0G950_IGNLU|nr:hypothetical protein ILUMI_09964 [Ignelater luminosus]
MKIWLLFVLLGVFFFCQISGDGLMVTLFYESLCPGCQEFITKQLYPAYPKLEAYITLDLVPYGNIQRTYQNGTWEFECQHGPKECTINKLEACGLAKSEDMGHKLEFVYCVESSAENQADVNTIAKCASKIGLPDSEILQCALGQEGNTLLGLLGDKQNLIAPNHKYVPWLEFNYKHDEKTCEDALTNFLKTVCTLLNDKPDVCSNYNEVPQY